jgi:hypothetical protein
MAGETAQEGFGDTLSCTGLAIELISITPPKITRGTYDDNTLANVGVKTKSASALYDVSDCSFTADVQLTPKAVLDLIVTGASLEFTYTCAGVSTVKWWGIFSEEGFDDASSDTESRHTFSGTVTATNRNATGVLTAPTIADVSS